MNNIKKVYQWFGSKNSILAFFLLFIFASIVFADRGFSSFNSVQNLLRKAASDGGFLALGMTFVIMVGGIDLSVGAVMALGGVAMALVAQVDPFLGLAVGLLVGISCGFLNGFMVAKMKLSAWIATLAMMLGVRGIVFLMTDRVPVSVTHPMLRALGNQRVLGFNILIIFLLISVFICMHISRNTRFGMGIYAVGGNEEAARMMGLKVDKIKIMAFTMSGLFASIAGILLAGRLYTAQPIAGISWETTAIAMCALGGVKLSGGEGKFSGTFFGIMIITVIGTIFNFAGNINSWWQNTLMGVLILIAVGVQSDVLKFKKKKILTKEKAWEA